jgi:hypothetical protein
VLDGFRHLRCHSALLAPAPHERWQQPCRPRGPAPAAYLKGRDGEQYITATRRGGRWWITPNTAVYPRRGTSSGD